MNIPCIYNILLLCQVVTKKWCYERMRSDVSNKDKKYNSLIIAIICPTTTVHLAYACHIFIIAFRSLTLGPTVYCPTGWTYCCRQGAVEQCCRIYIGLLVGPIVEHLPLIVVHPHRSYLGLRSLPQPLLITCLLAPHFFPPKVQCGKENHLGKTWLP